MSVVVVTDSSARLPADLLGQWDIRVVPLHVLVDGDDLRDGVDDMPTDLYQRPQVSTAGASPAELARVYRAACADSAEDGVVAVHLSTALSSTLGAAQHAAAEFGLKPVEEARLGQIGAEVLEHMIGTGQPDRS